MAKAKKEAPGTTTTEETTPAPKKKMSVEEAQAIVDRYSGINGAFVPDELKQAKQVLKAKASE